MTKAELDALKPGAEAALEQIYDLLSPNYAGAVEVYLRALEQYVNELTDQARERDE